MLDEETPALGAATVRDTLKIEILKIGWTKVGGVKILPVIMCGGSGTRMWPESRESLPKQFIPLIGERSTFQTIVSVVSDPAVFDPAVVITNYEYQLSGR